MHNNAKHAKPHLDLANANAIPFSLFDILSKWHGKCENHFAILSAKLAENPHTKNCWNIIKVWLLLKAPQVQVWNKCWASKSAIYHWEPITWSSVNCRFCHTQFEPCMGWKWTACHDSKNGKQFFSWLIFVRVDNKRAEGGLNRRSRYEWYAL